MRKGGLIARIGNAGTYGVETFPPMWYISEDGNEEEARYVGTTIGSYLSELGFNMDFAPDADVLTNPDNQVISTRSFGSDPDLVSRMVNAEVEGFVSKRGVTPVIKHFPGHGGTSEDTHEGYAYTDKTVEKMWNSELVPFRKAIEHGVDVIMFAHISVPNSIGDTTPSSLSRYMVTDILRKQLGYQEIGITVGMNMGAIANSYDSGEVACRALQAGVDMVLMPEDFYSAYSGVLQAIQQGTLSEERIDQSVRRILRVKWKNAQ